MAEGHAPRRIAVAGSLVGGAAMAAGNAAAPATHALALTAEPAAKLPRQSRLIVYEGAPHGLFVTHIARLNADIEAFARS